MDYTRLTGDLRKDLEDQKKKMGEQNNLKDRGAFISNAFLRKLMTVDNIRRNLEHDQTITSTQNPQELAIFIETRARKIFAILVLIGEGRRISSLQNGLPVVDDNLLFTKASNNANKPFCGLDKLQNIPALADIADKVYEQQWTFPAVFSPAIHLDFDPQHFRFPFKSEPTWIAAGAAGQVHGVEFEQGYIQDWEGRNTNIRLVYKKIRHDPERPQDMDKIMKEVKFLRARRHSNISPLLASFTAGLEQPPIEEESPTRCIYLVAPRAEMDMHKWFKDEPEYLKTFDSYESQDFIQHIYAIMRGLISGLAYIHRQIGFYVGYHGDLKPKNILKFESQDKLAWKISDFGTSNLKSVDSTSTKNLETTLYWAPKEFHSTFTRREDGNHGRSHDVWSLGCIFLQLATVLVHQWKPEGLQAFHNLRSKDTKEELDHAFCNSMPKVRQWINELRRKQPRKDFGRLLDLIEEMLQSRESRIFSWEAAVDLPSISDHNRSPEEITKHLNEVVQEARKADLNLKHNPLARARNDKKKGEEYFEVLMKKGWYDEKTSEEKKRQIMAKCPVTTLSTVASEDHLVGEEETLKQLSTGFEETASLALSGPGGVGKSLVARQYAENTTKQPQATDVFWVCARTIDSFDATYTAIAAKLTSDDPGFKSREDRWIFVKSRLEEKSPKGWLMVVDGFDDDRETQIMRTFLPARGSGKILITTRNSLLVKGLLDWRQGRACIDMEYPNKPTAMVLLRTYVGKDRIDVDIKSAEQILGHFKCPKMIRHTAQCMIEDKLSCRDIRTKLKQRKYQEVERLLPDFAGYLLTPTLGSSLLDENNRSHELRLLMLLCLFDNETGVDLKLVQVEYDEEAYEKVDEWLQKLVACHFVRKQETQSRRTVYLVDSTVHLAVLTWLEMNEPSRRKLERYNKVLSMLFRSYDARKRSELKKRKDKPSRLEKSEASFKALLMPHFRRFVEYTKASKRQTDFMLYDRAVQAVILFSDVLLHEDRYDDVIKVVQFTKMHFELPDLTRQNTDNKKTQDEEAVSETQKTEQKKRRRQRTIYFQLNTILVKSCLFRPEDQKSLQCLEQAERLVREMQDKASTCDDTVKWGGKTVRAWHLDVDLVRVHWKSGEFAKAWAEFKAVRKLGVIFHGHEAILPHLGGPPYDPKDKAELRMLAVRVKREESLLNMAQGDKFDHNDKHIKATDFWEKAFDACAEARKAVEQWFSTNTTLQTEISEDEAKILFKLGGKDDLDDAKNILERLLNPNGVKPVLEADKTAFDACAEARNAVEQRVSTNARLQAEINEDEAKIGGKDDLDDAKNILERPLSPNDVKTVLEADQTALASGPTRDCPGQIYKRKEWERTYLLNAVRLKRGEIGNFPGFVESLKQLKQTTQQGLGESHELTKNCTLLLEDASRLTAEEQKALNHEKRFRRSNHFKKRSHLTRRLKREAREYWCQFSGLVLAMVIMSWIFAKMVLG